MYEASGEVFWVLWWQRDGALVTPSCCSVHKRLKAGRAAGSCLAPPLTWLFQTCCCLGVGVGGHRSPPVLPAVEPGAKLEIRCSDLK